MAEPYRNVRGDRQMDPDRLPGGASAVRMIAGMDGVISSNKAAAIEVKNVAALLLMNAERQQRTTASLDSLVKSQGELIKALHQALRPGTSGVVGGAMMGYGMGVPGMGGPTPAMMMGPDGVMIPLPNVPSTAGGASPMPVFGEIPSTAKAAPVVFSTPTTSASPEVAPGTPSMVPAPGLTLPGIPSTVTPGMEPGTELDARTAPMPGRTVTGPTPSGFPEGHDQRQVQSNYDRLMKGRHYSVSQLRTDAVHSVGRAISSNQSFGPNLARDESGKWMRVDRTTGSMVGEASAADIRNMNIANRVRTAAGGIAEQGLGKGLLNALPEGVGAALGGGAAVLAVANQVADFAEKQRAENAYYQGITGGTNASAFRDRLDQTMFRFSQRGTMTGAQADELYKGVREMSMNPDETQNALAMATENWRKFGMDVADSIKVLQIAARSGQRDFTGLASSIADVTATAKASGMNANDARTDFTNLYNASAGTLTGQNTAADISSVLTQAKTKLGASYSNMDLSGMFSQDNIRRLAAQNGMTQSQFLYRTQGLQGAASAAGYIDKDLQGIANRVLGQNGRDIIAKYKRDNGISGKMSEAQIQDVSRLLADVVPDIGAVQQQLNAAKIVIPDLNDVLPTIVRIADGSINMSAEVQPLVDAAKTQKVGAGGMSAQDLGKALGVYRVNPSAGQLSTTGGGDVSVGALAGSSFTSGSGDMTNNSPASIYYDQALKSGTYSPLVKKAIDDKNVSGQKFRIRVGDKFYDMGMADALRYHADQMARGDVQVVDKEGNVTSTSLADAVGMSVNTDIKADYSQDGGTKGLKSIDATAAQQQGGSTSKSNVGVTIGLTAEARRLLTVTTNGGQLTTTVPSSSVLPSMRPSGN